MAQAGAARAARGPTPANSPEMPSARHIARSMPSVVVALVVPLAVPRGGGTRTAQCQSGSAADAGDEEVEAGVANVAPTEPPPRQAEARSLR